MRSDGLPATGVVSCLACGFLCCCAPKQDAQLGGEPPCGLGSDDGSSPSPNKSSCGGETRHCRVHNWARKSSEPRWATRNSSQHLRQVSESHRVSVCLTSKQLGFCFCTIAFLATHTEIHFQKHNFCGPYPFSLASKPYFWSYPLRGRVVHLKVLTGRM